MPQEPGTHWYQMTQWSAWDAFFARFFLLYGPKLRGATLALSGRNYSLSHLYGWDRALRGGVGELFTLVVWQSPAPFFFRVLVDC